MTEEWGPLIRHDGKGCPVTGMFCEVHTASRVVTCGIVMDNGGPCSLWVWTGLCILCLPHRVVAYRVRKPRALLDLIDMVENLPTPSKIKETEDV